MAPSDNDQTTPLRGRRNRSTWSHRALNWLLSLCDPNRDTSGQDDTRESDKTKIKGLVQDEKSLKHYTHDFRSSQYKSSKKNHKKSKKPKGLLNLDSNLCFANSSLQCLANLSDFRASLKQVSHSNWIAKLLNDLLTKLTERDSDDNYLDLLKKELFKEIQNKTGGIEIFKERGGDSRYFFMGLAWSILGEDSRKESPAFSLFCSGDLEKQVQCTGCPSDPLKYVETPLMLSVQEDLYYSGEKAANFFQEDFEMRKCKNCFERGFGRTKHKKKISLKTFPKILALRIGENSNKKLTPKDCKTHLTLSFHNKEGERQDYEFISGVYNTQRGFNGHHSVAYVKKQDLDRTFDRKDEEEFLMFNDQNVGTVKYSEMRGYPKLLFYCQVEKPLVWKSEDVGNIAHMIHDEEYFRN